MNDFLAILTENMKALLFWEKDGKRNWIRRVISTDPPIFAEVYGLITHLGPSSFHWMTRGYENNDSGYAATLEMAQAMTDQSLRNAGFHLMDERLSAFL